MVMNIEKMTEEKLLDKIASIEKERERTAKALQEYKEELERRKSLGVPVGEVIYSAAYRSEGTLFAELTMKMEFNSFNSFCKYRNFLVALNRVLAANAKGEPIDIKVLCPLLKKGKVLYSPYDEKWKWVEQEAVVFAEEHGWYIKKSQVLPIEGFNIKPAGNWEDSLRECGL